MLTDLQRRKLEHFFGVFDADRDGYLEWPDMERWAQNMARVRGAAPGSPEYDDLHAMWKFTWDALEKVADRNRDGLVSPKEWLDLADQLLSTDEGYNTVMNAIGLRTFDVLDTDEDAQLTLDDWRSFYKAIEIDDGTADQVFPYLDRDGDGRISRDETMDRLREFFCSDDSDAPGNWFFGPLATV